MNPKADGTPFTPEEVEAILDEALACNRIEIDLLTEQLRVAREMVRRAQTLRCMVCGFPLAPTQTEGCIQGDCSYRPEQGHSEHECIRPYREALAAIEKGEK